MKRLLNLLITLIVLGVCAPQVFAFDVLNISPSTPFSDIATQIDHLVIRSYGGNPNDHVGAYVLGTECWDFVDNTMYVCSVTDGSGNPSATTWLAISDLNEVFTNTTNTYTGATIQDFSGSSLTLKLPTKADPGSPSTSSVWLSGSTGTVMKFRDNAGSPVTHTLLDTAGTSPMAGSLNMNTHAIHNLVDPTALQDAATENWVINNVATNVLPDGRIWVGNGSSVATPLVMSGDATLSDTGVLTISKLDTVPIAPSAIIDTTDASNIIFGTLSPNQLPNPTSSTIGGVKSLTPVSSKWINQITTAGLPIATQPAFTDISGQIAAGQLPTLTSTHILVGNGSNLAAGVALSGDATISNTGVLTVTKTGGASFAPSATTDTTDASNIVTGTIADGLLSADVVLSTANNFYAPSTIQNMNSAALFQLPLTFDPASNPGALWVNGSSIKVWDNAGSPVSHVLTTTDQMGGSVTTVPGSTSGNLYWAQSASTTAKHVTIQLVALTDAGLTITFATPFTNTPQVSFNGTGLTISTISSTQIVIPSTTATNGVITVDGI